MHIGCRQAFCDLQQQAHELSFLCHPLILTFSKLFSALLTSSQPFSAHSQIILGLLWPKTCSKTGSWRQSHKKYDFEGFLKGFWKGKSKAPKTRKNSKISKAYQTCISCETSLKTESWRCENEAFVRDFPQTLKVEELKTKLSSETSLNNWKLKIWKQSFGARHPSNAQSWRVENEAFVGDFPEKHTNPLSPAISAGLPQKNSWHILLSTQLEFWLVFSFRYFLFFSTAG